MTHDLSETDRYTSPEVFALVRGAVQDRWRYGLRGLGALLVVAATTASAQPISILTFNLRSRLDHADRREPAIAAFLSEQRPDIVLFQEVALLGGRERTQAHRMAQAGGYEVAHCHNARTRRGLAVLSRYPILDSVVISLPPNGRPALAVTINVHGRTLSVVNVHLTPALEARQVRSAEVRSALELLETMPGIGLLGGDLNFGDHDVESALVGHLVDAYRQVEPTSPGHTWDLRNPLARKNSFPTEPSRRLDRLLFAAPNGPTSPRVRVDSSELVLTLELTSTVAPSDHYGLLSRVAFLDPPTSAGAGEPTQRGGSPLPESSRGVIGAAPVQGVTMSRKMQDQRAHP